MFYGLLQAALLHYILYTLRYRFTLPGADHKMEMRPSGLGKSICTPQLKGNFTYYIRIRYVELARLSVCVCVGGSKGKENRETAAQAYTYVTCCLTMIMMLLAKKGKRERDSFARVDRQTFSNAPNSGVSCLPRPPPSLARPLSWQTKVHSKALHANAPLSKAALQDS